MLKVIYTFFLGLLIALFVGIGVSVFYDAPQYPEYPEQLKYSTGAEMSEEELQAQHEYDQLNEQYAEQEREYSKNVSIVLTVAAVLLLAIGIVLNHKLDVLSDGILLGGVFTLLYAIIRGLASEDEAFQFIVISVGLAVALWLGWWKFVKPEAGKKKG